MLLLNSFVLLSINLNSMILIMIMIMIMILIVIMILSGNMLFFRMDIFIGLLELGIFIFGFELLLETGVMDSQIDYQL